MSQVDDLGGQSPVRRLRVVLTRLWLVALVALVCAGTAYFIANHQTRMYQATARLMYQPPTDVTNPASATSSVNTDSMAIQLQSVSSMLGDPAVRDRALTGLGGEDSVPGYTVTATIVTPENNTSVVVFPNMVEIMAETDSATAAAKIANAYAAAIIATRQQNQVDRYRAAQQAVDDQLKLFDSPESKQSLAYVNLVEQRRNLLIARTSATGDFSVVVPATPPATAASPKPMRSAALGLGVGLVAGVALAFLVSAFDTRVRSHRKVAEILGLPVVGRVPALPKHTLKNAELVVLAEPYGQFSEALRMLRSYLDWASVDGHLRSILVTSCVKGEGKSVTMCNLAVTLARSGKRVVVIDADLRVPRVHELFGLPNEVGLTSLVRGSSDLKDVLQVFSPEKLATTKKKGGSGTSAGDDVSSSPAGKGDGALWVLTSGPLPPDPGEFVATMRMASALKQLAGMDVDYVLVDAPPILSVGDTAALSASVNALLLVTNLDRVNRPTLVDGRDQLDLLPCRKVGVVVVGEHLEHKAYQQ